MTKREDDLWGPIDRTAWRDVPAVCDRLATETDVRQGRAVFYLSRDGEVDAEPIGMSLPALAIHTDQESDTETPVILIQAEQADGRQLIGYRPLDDGNGIGLRFEFSIVDEPDARFDTASS